MSTRPYCSPPPLNTAAHPPAIAQAGFTLLELIIFIVIVSVAAVGIMGALATTLRASATSGQITQATHIAQERMELILAQERRLGFAGFTAATFDPCVPAAGAPAQCTPPANYSFTTAPALTTPAANIKEIIVVVDFSGGPLARLTAQVSNY